MSRSILVIACACAGLWLAGCAGRPSAPGSPASVTLAVRWGAAGSAGSDSMIDQLVAEGLDASGAGTGDSAYLQLLPDRTFSGRLAMRAGSGRTVRVKALARGDEFYRGESAPFSVGASDSVRVSVTMAPSVTLRLAQTVRPVVFADTVDLGLSCTSTAALRGVQADVTFDPLLMTFIRPASHSASLSGFQWAAIGTGRLRVLLYGTSPSERVGTGQDQLLFALRFLCCPSGQCSFQRTTPIGLENVTVTGAHGLSQPLSGSADSVVFTP